MELEGKVAIVTGASRGIGRATALALARAGARVVISARSRETLAEGEAEIREAGGEAIVHAGDLRDEAAVSGLVASTLRAFGRLDVLVNNAGLGHFREAAELSTEEWDEMFDLNVRSVFLLTRECLPALRKAGDSAIVNVVSLAGKHAFATGAGYAATKHALLGFTRCLLLEERDHGVRVVAICPGSVATDFFAGHPDPPDPSRILRPEDVASSILHALQAPTRATLSEIDIRPSRPGR
jgi:3-oxoacyl-[acyl-carrier protein] reductase